MAILPLRPGRRDDAQGYGVGGSLTWYGMNGFYVDAQAQVSWLNSDISSTTLGTVLADGNDGLGYALGIETGYKFALNESWSLTPQAQLVYSRIDFDDFTDPFGATVALRDGDSLRARVGLAAEYETRWTAAKGTKPRAIYGIANLTTSSTAIASIADGRAAATTGCGGGLASVDAQLE